MSVNSVGRPTGSGIVNTTQYQSWVKRVKQYGTLAEIEKYLSLSPQSEILLLTCVLESAERMGEKLKRKEFFNGLVC